MKDPVAVLTGATGWLGTALTERLLAKGYRIAATYLMPVRAEEYEDRFPYDEDQLILRRVNAVEPEQIGGFMETVASRFGRIDVVAALVGGWAGGRDVADTDDIRFDLMIDINLRSAFYTVRAAIPYLEASGGGRILLVGSRAAVDTPPGQAAFNIAKAGVIALAKTAALEVEESDITVNVILPSVIDTPRTRAALPYSDYVKVARAGGNRRGGRLHPDRRVRGHIGCGSARLREDLNAVLRSTGQERPGLRGSRNKSGPVRPSLPDGPRPGRSYRSPDQI